MTPVTLVLILVKVTMATVILESIKTFPSRAKTFTAHHVSHVQFHNINFK